LDSLSKTRINLSVKAIITVKISSVCLQKTRFIE
jgi:hypothetical protein